MIYNQGMKIHSGSDKRWTARGEVALCLECRIDCVRKERSRAHGKAVPQNVLHKRSTLNGCLQFTAAHETNQHLRQTWGLFPVEDYFERLANVVNERYYLILFS